MQGIRVDDCDDSRVDAARTSGKDLSPILRQSPVLFEVVHDVYQSPNTEKEHYLTQAYFDSLSSDLLANFGISGESSGQWTDYYTEIMRYDDPDYPGICESIRSLDAVMHTLSVLMEAEKTMPGIITYYLDFFVKIEHPPTHHKLAMLDFWRKESATLRTLDKEDDTYTQWLSYQQELLVEAGLSQEHIRGLLESYWHCSWQNDSFVTLTENVQIIRRIAQSHGSDAVRLLVAERGIHCFSRYPYELLLDQLHPPITDRCILTIYPRTDHNEGLSAPGEILYILERTSGMDIRFLEVASPHELARMLFGLRRKWKGVNFEMVLANAHSTPDFMYFGEQTGETPWKKDVIARYCRLFSRFLAPNSTVVLNACSTGTGLHQHIADGLSAGSNINSVTVYAPDRPTNLKSIKFNGQDSSNPFVPEYNHPESARRAVNSTDSGQT